MIQTILMALVMATFGLALCFLGYRLFLVMLPIWGFFAGFWIGAQAVMLVFQEGFLATTTGFVVGLIAGLFFAIFSYLFYGLGVIVVSAAFGWAVAGGFMAWLGMDSGLIYVLVAGFGALVMVIVSLIANLQKYAIIAISAVGGANALLAAVLLLFGRTTLDALGQAGSTIQPVLADSWFWLVIWALLALAGMFVQVRTSMKYTFTRKDYVQGWG